MTGGFLPDTTVMVATLSPWHPAHVPAAREVNRRLAASQALVIAAPALTETYSVLTRLPMPYRIAPTQAWDAIRASFILPAVAVVALDGDGYRRFLDTSAAGGISGGRVYDALIVACAAAGAVDVLLTFNQRHFEDLARGRVQVVVPT